MEDILLENVYVTTAIYFGGTRVLRNWLPSICKRSFHLNVQHPGGSTVAWPERQQTMHGIYLEWSFEFDMIY